MGNFMFKRKSYIILFSALLLLQVLIFQPIQSKATFSSLTAQPIQTFFQPANEPITADVGGTERIKTNVFRDGGCEVEGAYGQPAAFYTSGSGYNHANHSYQDEVHSGSYGAYISSRGTEQRNSQISDSKYFLNIPERSYLDEKITLDFWYNAKANPDHALGAQIYFLVMISTDIGNHYLHYYLSRVSGLPTNQTNFAYIDIRGSLNTWTNIVRNITYDFEDSFSTGADFSVSYIRQMYFYVTSVRNSAGDTILLFDDITCTNDTGFDYLLNVNGDFEDGNSNWWSDEDSGPGSVYLTSDDYTQGSSAMNMTAMTPLDYSNSYAHSYKEINDGWETVPKGYYCNQPGDLVFSFDWKYSDLPGIGTQYAYFLIHYSNETVSGTNYFILGDESDNLADFWNYTSSNWFQYYLATDDLGVRDTWNHFEIDYYTIMTSLDLPNQIAYNVGFYLHCGQAEELEPQLLVDDFKVTTYPISDPSFEGVVSYNPSDPILYWRTPNDPNYVNITTDAYSGNYAANLSSYGGYSNVYSRRRVYLPIVDNLFTDFWWRIDDLTDTGGGLAYTDLYLQIDQTRYIRYVLGNNSNYFVLNDSTHCFYYVENHNQIGTWNNLFRNVTNDVITAFGPGNWNITEISLSASATGTDKVTTIFDDIYFVRDIEGPTIVNLELNPTEPAYNGTVEVSVDVYDNILLDEVKLHYKIDDSAWGSTPMSVVANKFVGTIPIAAYGVTCSYYIEAKDIWGFTSELGSETSPLTYVVGDFINPVLVVDAPSESVTLSGTVIFDITEGYDVGSDIASFDIIINGTSVYSEITVPTNYTWNTEEYENADYVVIFTIADNAGNGLDLGFLYTVYNPPTQWEVFVAFMIKWGPYIGGGVGALLIGILAIVIVVRRKKRMR